MNRFEQHSEPQHHRRTLTWLGAVTWIAALAPGSAGSQTADPRDLPADATQTERRTSASDVFFDRIVPAILAGTLVIWAITFAEIVLDFAMRFPG